MKKDPLPVVGLSNPAPSCARLIVERPSLRRHMLNQNQPNDANEDDKKPDSKRQVPPAFPRTAEFRDPSAPLVSAGQKHKCMHRNHKRPQRRGNIAGINEEPLKVAITPRHRRIGHNIPCNRDLAERLNKVGDKQVHQPEISLRILRNRASRRT